MTRFVTQLEPLISLSDHRASSHAREHEDQARRTQLRKPITSVPLTGTGAAHFCNSFCVSKLKRMATKNHEEATLMARNSSRILVLEKIQIH